MCVLQLLSLAGAGQRSFVLQVEVQDDCSVLVAWVFRRVKMHRKSQMQESFVHLRAPPLAATAFLSPPTLVSSGVE